MLVLTRCKEQSIMINDDIEITVVDVCGRKVRLGITAPRSIAVHRREVYDAIQAGREKEKIVNVRDVGLHTCAVGSGH